jgi:DNA-binding NarL/FixJ family response regulator
MHVVGEAATGEEAIIKARGLKPDVILMDLSMPGMGGAAAIGILRVEAPEARILVLTNFDDDSYITAALQAGALGYLRKDTSPDELFEALHKVARGTSYLSQEVVQKIVKGVQTPKSTSKKSNELTEREIDVLAALAKGMSNREIADLLLISTTTVRSHVRHLLDKLGMTNRTEAAVYAVESGLLCSRVLSA